MQEKYACIAGASGLVGSKLLDLLLQGEAYSGVIAIGRRELPITHPKLIQIVTDFEHITPIDERVADVFCCIGTTIKKAKSKEQMIKVDVTYPLNLARWGLEQGAEQFLLVSSMNANAASKLFYPRIKGQLEEQVRELAYSSIAIFRPSLLLGERNEFRFAEQAANKLVQTYASWTGKRPSSRIAIPAESVAAAMVRIAAQQEPGINVYSAEDISELTAEK